MKSPLTVSIFLGMIAILFIYLFFYIVRYDEVAVVTRFGKADVNDVVNEPGLKVRGWPWPLVKVQTYSKRIKLLEDQLEEFQTADGKAVVIQLFVAWRIDNALDFFKTLKNEAGAKDTLRPVVRDLKSVISNYNFDQLVNLDRKKLKLATIETEAKQELQSRLESESQYGIVIERVGIRRVVLPEKVTEKVFESMQQARQALAETARAEGRAKAAAIRSEAASAKDRILAFAERRAQAIRAEGDREAAKYYAQFAENEDFAIFLRKVEALKQMLSNNSTFVMDAKSFTPLELFKEEGSK